MIFDRPTSSELIKAVMDFLETKIKDELPPHLAFKLRITNNKRYLKILRLKQNWKL